MKLLLIDSKQCHLWTDALHMRQLAHDAVNRWDRGTYVRLCIMLAWTALEIRCQESLNSPDIGYSFKRNIDRAIANKGLPSLDWSKGIWQEIRRIQELRKSCVHQFTTLADMFPESSLADDVIAVVKSAIEAISDHASVPRPAWIGIDHSSGWAGRSGASDSCSASLITGGTYLDDPAAIRIYYVAEGKEYLSSVHPQGFNYLDEVYRLVEAVNIPIYAIRVYIDKSLEHELLVYMRGN